MHLSKGWHTILRFAVVGFSIGTIAAVSVALHGPDIITYISSLLSPAIMLFLPEPVRNTLDKWLMLFFGAIANGSLYALLGATLVVLRPTPE